MKKTIVLIALAALLIPALALSQSPVQRSIMAVIGLKNTPSGGSDECDGKLVCQNFEGTGYDNSETWLEVLNGGTVDEDNTTATVLRGSQQLYMLGAGGNAAQAATPEFSAQSSVWVHFRAKLGDATPSSAQYFFYLVDSESAAQLILQYRTDGNIRIYHSLGSYATSSSGGFSGDNTKLHIWVYYAAGSGSNGVYAVYTSANGTKPETAIAGGTNGGSTGNVVRAVWQEANATATGLYIDQVLVSSSAIGNVAD